jgi:hypothetical protein
MITTLLEGVTAANSAPSAATDGVPLWKHMTGFVHPGEGFVGDIEEVELLMFHTAYSAGVPALASARWWGGYRVSESSLVWVAGGTGTGNTGTSTDKGRLNAGATIEGGATSFFHGERLRGIREMERIALQVGAFTGTWTLRAILMSRGPVRT